MEQFGKLWLVIAILFSFYGFAYDVSSPGSRIVNQQLLTMQSNIIIFGGLMIVASILLIGFGKLSEASKVSSMSPEVATEYSERKARNKKITEIVWAIIALGAAYFISEAAGLW